MTAAPSNHEAGSLPTSAEIRRRIAACVAAGDPVVTRCADDLYAILDKVDREAQ